MDRGLNAALDNLLPLLPHGQSHPPSTITAVARQLMAYELASGVLADATGSVADRVFDNPVFTVCDGLF